MRHVAEIRAKARDSRASAEARAYLRQIAQLHLREFDQTVGPEALLYWAATYREIAG